MKKIFLIAFATLFIFASCKKDDEKTDETSSPDNIELTTIDKSIGVDEELTVSTTCPELIFSIISPNKQVLRCEIAGSAAGCDGGGTGLLLRQSGVVKVLNEGEVISGTGEYAHMGVNSTILSLEDFAGEGDKYLGIQISILGSEGTSYKYGWIKVKLSATMDVLKVYDMGLNNTIGNSIRAGQIE